MVRILNQMELCCKPLVVSASNVEDFYQLSFYDASKGFDCYRFFESDFYYYIELCCNNFKKINTVKDRIFVFIEGVSHFENQEKFYQDILQFILLHYADKAISLIFKPYYFSSSSKKHIANLILAIKKEVDSFNVFWITTDEEGLEAGEDMHYLLGSPDYFIF